MNTNTARHDQNTYDIGDYLACPECGSDTRANLDSRLIQIGRRRRRECVDCRHRFSTIEIRREVYDELVKQSNAAQRSIGL